MSLQIEYISVDALKPYERNAKEHRNVDVKAIARSITEFGFSDPIGIWGKDNVIVEGHGRLMAAKQLKMTEVPCIRLDHLTDEQRRAYALAHNKTAELSEWDLPNLQAELSDISSLDMSDFGFDIQEDPVLIGEDEVPEVPEEPTARYGQVWQLGKHRVMCGDATKIRDVEILLAGESADLVVTDPPYNMGYEGAGNTKKGDRRDKRILNDKLPEEEFRKFLEKSFASYINSMKDGATLYTFYKELGNAVFITELARSGLTFKQELIWVKDHLVLGGSKYQSIYEPFLMACKGKQMKIWNGGRKQTATLEQIDFMEEEELREALKEALNGYDTDIFREKKQTVNDLHPTMKPVRLIARLIQNSSDKGQMVLDLFGGSGTTLIAAEQTGRRAYLMELDPRYVDVIIRRYEMFTGETALLLEENAI